MHENKNSPRSLWLCLKIVIDTKGEIMKKCSIAQLAAVVAVLLLTAGVGAALSLGSSTDTPAPGPGPGGPGPGMPPGPPLMRCVDQLNLSTDTKSAIDALVQADRESMQAAFESHKTLMDAYLAALTTSPLNESALASAQQALAAQQQTDTESLFALDRSIVELLTADEVAALAECMAAAAPPATTTTAAQ
jgi:Spy/CpxP family protein refolding chaperone